MYLYESILSWLVLLYKPLLRGRPSCWHSRTGIPPVLKIQRNFTKSLSNITRTSKTFYKIKNILFSLRYWSPIGQYQLNSALVNSALLGHFCIGHSTFVLSLSLSAQWILPIEPSPSTSMVRNCASMKNLNASGRSAYLMGGLVYFLWDVDQRWKLRKYLMTFFRSV